MLGYGLFIYEFLEDALTYQIKNKIIIGNKKFDLFSGQGKGLFNPRSIGLNARSTSTATKHGFYAEYTLLVNYKDEPSIFLTKLTFDCLEKISELGTYPKIFYGEPVINSDGSIVYDDIEEPVPYTGILYGEKGFFNHRGLRQPTPNEDWYESKESVFVEIENGKVVNLRFDETEERNEIYWQTYLNGVTHDPFLLGGDWPKWSYSLDNLIEIGNSILSKKATPRAILSIHPFFRTSEKLFEESVVPALKLKFKRSFDESFLGFLELD